MLVTLIVFIIILGLLIFVHELGHFIMAKRAGIKVEEFAFGFPPRIVSFKKGETEYSLNLVPFGGYVKMLGEAEDVTQAEKRNTRSFAHQSVWVRSKVVIAGVIMNIILGWFLITLGFSLGMTPVVTPPEKIPYAATKTEVVIAGIMEQSAAEAMGLKPGDKVVKIQDQTVADKSQLANLTQQFKGQPVTIEVVRDGKTVSSAGKLGDGETPLGVALNDDTKVRLPVWWAPVYAVWETIKASGLIFVGILKFFRELFVSRSVPAEAAGPVGIFYYTQSVLALGFTALLNFTAILSVNLAIINILPIPALDGGRLLFILLEKFNKGKKVINARIENTAHMIGFVLLILLILGITYNDILRLGR